jgi:mannose-1-phosphate guanylyltransferase
LFYLYLKKRKRYTTDMIAVIIAGGSGTRLWPLSQPNYPKHLLRLTGEKSLLQNTDERAKKFAREVYIITEASHADEVALQLPELKEDHIIVEPARRGTASCIALALARVKAKKDEPIVFLHADHHITDADKFAQAVVHAANAAEANNKIALIGLEPTYPATGFGYIKKGVEAGEDLFLVESFREKPDFGTAQEYIASGEYLWNLGLFAATKEIFSDNFAEFAPILSEAMKALAKIKAGHEEEERLYLSLENLPIDTALIEKTPNLLVVPGTFDWADIGSFTDLHKVLKQGSDNVLQGDVYQLDCEDSMIHASTKPIIAIGLSGVVVIDTPDGLLVCSKEQSQRVGELSKKLQTRQVQSPDR